MAHNPVMNKNPYFRDPSQMQRPSAPTGYEQGYAYGQNAPYTAKAYGQQVNGAEQVFANTQAQGYAAQSYTPSYQSASPADRMSYDDAMVKTLTLLGVAIVAGVLTAMFVPIAMVSTLAIITSLAALGVSFMAALRPMVSPALAIAYSALEGVALGGITGALNLLYPGIAFQAILGTVIVVGVATALHMSGTVRTSPKGRKVVLVIMVAGLVYSLINLVLVLTGINTSFRGMDTSISFFGIPLGVLLGLVMIVVAGYLLISDLEQARYAVDNGAPRAFAWTVAFGIASTIMWIYVEVLRVLSILASDD